MSEAPPTLEEQYRTAIDSVVALPKDVGVYRAQSEKGALKIAALQAELARAVAATAAVVAGDLAYRSRPELGGEGLAHRSGFRTVEHLVKATTGASKQQAVT